jgi:outer membrane scaffolding protein for murein synthesis (MipA/OmpV family)
VAVLGTCARPLGDAADSPIGDDVGDANQFFAGASINYQF